MLDVIKAKLQDYMDELWAERAVAEFNKNKHQKLYSLTDAKRQLGRK